MTKLLLPAVAAVILIGLLANLMIPFLTRIAVAARAVDGPGSSILDIGYWAKA